MKYFFIWILINFISTVTQAEGTRGGGNDTALSFQQSGRIAVKSFESDLSLANVNLIKLNKLISDSIILVVKDDLSISVDGTSQPSVAINEPRLNRILVNANAWNLIGNPRMQEALALHEYLSLLGLESTGKYPFSQAYLAKVGKDGNISLSCFLGDDNYNEIILTPANNTWPISDPVQGSVKIDFGGFRFGGMLIGSYRYKSNSELNFVVSSAGDSTSVVAGTISNLRSANPILRVSRGPYFIKNKNTKVPCEFNN